ncbi:phosphoketolase family protein [Mycolicibacterium confluentis]|uniref:Probable phosphoketolase n=1 Tax=Mycolicibacterium confluentis TaxID=28047 RepID=A0A7I7XWQ8_9MYCO|nr:phosphoketolase family protein [Mycolicibacterium confluentis]MCV7321690.1 phosphoketolase family protein [Mycolicibacterium confluentis]ORV31973.1 phosphoketolase [Mycolicibacterium confluentis]BBZ33501.1 putative phosphoketolase [Mycolicibacterium confluentis]
MTSWTHRDAAPLPDDTLTRLDGWWRAANYLSVGQIYLLRNPLLRTPLTRDDVKPRLLGHWGTTPGLNFLYAHLNRVIAERSQSTIYVTGPGHGGPGLVASAYLDGTYTEIYPDITGDTEGLTRLFRQFSFPGGIPSHVAPETPGSIHEGGELGYALSHAYGAAFDNPHLLVAAVVGDGEAETGPLATSWHSNKLLNPAKDGVVLPILHLNGYKIANPTVLARIPSEELSSLMVGYGHHPYFFEVSEDEEHAGDPADAHRRFATLLDEVLNEIATLKAAAAAGDERRPCWPMIVFRTPKGWTGPAYIDGKKTTGSWRAHQVPLSNARDTAEHLQVLADWLASYRPDELFDADGRIDPEIAALAPDGQLRMSDNPHANGGLLLKDLRLPDFRDFAVDVPAPGATVAEATRVLGQWLTEVVRRNPDNFRIFGPDETASNRLQAVYDATDKQWDAEYLSPEVDEHLARAGQVVEMLSEHQCEGWLEGYLLTGRHGLFNCYEAFIHVIDSMFNQHAKWLKVTNHIPWRRPIASLNYLLSSHVWRQDHNGFSHQDPGFIDHVVNKSADVVRVYLPPDANTLLSTYDHCLRTRQYVNVVVSGKQPAPNFLTMEQAIAHCTRGLGIWEWASTEELGSDPDVVLAAAGDVPTLEALAAADLLRAHLPDLKVRFVNVVDLMRLQDATEHPHGLSSDEFDMIFTRDKPIIFAYHGYPWLIHRLTYRRTNHGNLHVRGYKEEGTTTTPFDMVMLNDLDRYHLVMDVIDRVPGLKSTCAALRQEMMDSRIAAREYTREHGDDIPEVRDWVWPAARGSMGPDGASAASATGGDNE